MQFFEKVVGAERYTRFAFSNAAAAVLVLAAALSGAVVYLKWHDRLAYFAWVPAALWALHFAAIRWTGNLSHPARLEIALDLLAITVAYSAGAGVSDFVGRRIEAKATGR